MATKQKPKSRRTDPRAKSKIPVSAVPQEKAQKPQAAAPKAAKKSDDIELSVKIYATAAEIWSALTDPDELEEWWSEGVTLEPKVGGKFREAWKDDRGQAQLASGKVLAVKAKSEIRFSWREKDWLPDIYTECLIRIQDEQKHRLLSIVHSGWNHLPEAKRTKLMNEFKVGWGYHLQELKSYLDDGP